MECLLLSSLTASTANSQPMERYVGDLNEDNFWVDLSVFKSMEQVEDVDEPLGDIISRTCLVRKVCLERFLNAAMVSSSEDQASERRSGNLGNDGGAAIATTPDPAK